MKGEHCEINPQKSLRWYYHIAKFGNLGVPSYNGTLQDAVISPVIAAVAAAAAFQNHNVILLENAIDKNKYYH